MTTIDWVAHGIGSILLGVGLGLVIHMIRRRYEP
jgi:hypothetical protein